MTFIDANIFMYAAGADHPNKAPSVQFLDAVARGDVAAMTSVEVLQEILHRYRAIDRWKDGGRLYAAVRQLMELIVDVTLDDVDAARDLMDANERLSARDALHAAVALHSSCSVICSYDLGFDALDEPTRRTPDAVVS